MNQMSKVEKICDSLHKFNLSYFIVFAITLYLSLLLYTTRKPIQDFKSFSKIIDLYEHKPQKLYHPFRTIENKKLFEKIESEIEFGIKSITNNVSINWDAYKAGNKEYEPLRYSNYDKFNSDLTIEEIFNLLKSKKEVVFPDKIINCYSKDSFTKIGNLQHSIRLINTDNLLSKNDTVEITMAIISARGTEKVETQFYDDMLIRCKCTKGTIVQDTINTLKQIGRTSFRERVFRLM